MPGVTFGERLSIDLGGRRVEVRALGLAHTVGDAVVWLPDERILAAGDLVEDAFPWIDAGSDVAGRARALAYLEALDPAQVLPSHGETHADPGFLGAHAALLAAIVDAALVGQGERGDPEQHPYSRRFALSDDAFTEAFAAAVASARGGAGPR